MVTNMTAAITTGVSFIRIEVIISVPRPGSEKTDSMMTVPPSR